MNSIGRQGNRDQLPRFVVQLVCEKGGASVHTQLFGFQRSLGFFFRPGAAPVSVILRKFPSFLTRLKKSCRSSVIADMYILRYIPRNSPDLRHYFDTKITNFDALYVICARCQRFCHKA
jgi:hypothetical protein